MRYLIIILTVWFCVSAHAQSLTNRRLIRIIKQIDGSYNTDAWVDGVGGTPIYNYSTVGQKALCTAVNSSSMSGLSGESNYVELWFDLNNNFTRALFIISASNERKIRIPSEFNSGQLNNIESLRIDVMSQVDPGLISSYFVSNSGSDANDGRTTLTPWKTLTQVTNTTFTAGDNILFKRGDSFYGMLSLKGSNKSGTLVSNITFNAYGSGELPIITGFTNVTSWSNVNGNLWSSSGAISALGSCNMVTINGTNYARGRTPNGNTQFVIDSSGANYITSSSITSATNYIGGEIVVFNSLFTVIKRTITNQYVNTLAYSGTDVSMTSEHGFFVQNHTNCLNSANEWMLDGSNNKLYLYSSGSPSGTIKASTVDNTVSLSNNDFITFKNLHITGANSSGIFNSGSETNTVQSCVLDFNGYNGYSATLGVNVTGLLLADCVISNNNNNGIVMAATSGSGGMKSFEIARNYISYSGMYPGHYNSSSSAGFGQHIRANGEKAYMHHNVLNYCGYTGISCFGTNTTVVCNIVDNSQQILSDGAGIYTWNASSTDTPDGCVNMLIASNLVFRSGPAIVDPTSTLFCGIYLDAQTQGTTIYGNTLAHHTIGLFQNYGDNINYINNNIYDNKEYSLYLDCDKNTSELSNFDAHGNTCIATNSAQDCIKMDSAIGVPATMYMNSNFYGRPASLSGSALTNLFLNGSTARSLVAWQAVNGLDLTSHGKPPNSVATAADVLFLYNATDTNQTHTLPYTMIDMVTNVYTNPITLTPWTSKTLLKQ